MNILILKEHIWVCSHMIENQEIFVFNIISLHFMLKLRISSHINYQITIKLLCRFNTNLNFPLNLSVYYIISSGNQISFTIFDELLYFIVEGLDSGLVMNFMHFMEAYLKGVLLNFTGFYFE